MRNSEIGVIALVPDRWHGIWMPRHQVLHRLADHFEVVWVEPARNWRNYWLWRTPEGQAVQNVPADRPGFTLYQPGKWLPEVYRPRSIGNWIRRQRVHKAAKLLRQKGCKKIVLYLWRPDFRWALDAIDADLTCYHIDDEYRFSLSDSPNDPREVALIRAVDIVIIHSRKLVEKKGGFNSNTVQIPNGVDYRAFSTPQREPADLATIPRPRVGYVGVIKLQLDMQLLLSLAKTDPQWSFVMVGPVGHLGDKEAAFRELTALTNVHVLGNKQLAELPGYCQHMDVCLMAYEVTDYTNFIYPLKLHEYLATGRPVVSTPIDAVLQFRDVVHVASDAEEWRSAIAGALRPDHDAPKASAARQARSRDYDWDHLVGRIAEEFRSRLT